MELDKAFEKLQQSSEFKAWNKENKVVFASYALNMTGDEKEDSWHFGFYNKSTDKIATFIVNKGKIELIEEEDVFKKPETQIHPIDISKAKMPFKKILELSSKFLKETYPKEQPNKTIAIFQNIDTGLVWNITYLTNSYNTINLKVNPENGRVVHQNIESLMSLIKK